MKLWIDDERLPPDWSWTRAITAKEAMRLLIEHIDEIEMISFDHDLGDGHTSMVVAETLELWARLGFGKQIGARIHSANPVGCRNLGIVLARAEEYWVERTICRIVRQDSKYADEQFENLMKDE